MANQSHDDDSTEMMKSLGELLKSKCKTCNGNGQIEVNGTVTVCPDCKGRKVND